MQNPQPWQSAVVASTWPSTATVLGHGPPVGVANRWSFAGSRGSMARRWHAVRRRPRGDGPDSGDGEAELVGVWGWPADEDELIELQRRLAAAATETEPWVARGQPVIGGCFVASGRGSRGAGRAGEPGWAAAVAWRPAGGRRRPDRHLRGASGTPRRADDVLAQAVVAGVVAAPYRAGYLALREGPLLASVVAALDVRPDVLLVDATGADHPRRAGLALHLGAALDMPTVGVTRRPLIAVGAPPPLERGATAPVELDGRRVGSWVCTRSGTAPVVAHAGWRTTADTAVDLVLRASTPAASTPVPLQEARRVAREARAAGATPPR